MLRTILIYGALLAVGSIGLQWLQYRFVVRAYPVETYVTLIALGFLGLGIWVGARLFRRVPLAPFQTNTRVRETLGISDRELEVLQLVAAGQSNKQIASRLPNHPFLRLGARKFAGIPWGLPQPEQVPLQNQWWQRREPRGHPRRSFRR